MKARLYTNYLCKDFNSYSEDGELFIVVSLNYRQDVNETYPDPMVITGRGLKLEDNGDNTL